MYKYHIACKNHNLYFKTNKPCKLFYCPICDSIVNRKGKAVMSNISIILSDDDKL